MPIRSRVKLMLTRRRERKQHKKMAKVLKGFGIKTKLKRDKKGKYMLHVIKMPNSRR